VNVRYAGGDAREPWRGVPPLALKQRFFAGKCFMPLPKGSTIKSLTRPFFDRMCGPDVFRGNITRQ